VGYRATIAVGLLLLALTSQPVAAQEPSCVVPVAGPPTGTIDGVYDAPGGLLIEAANGLFRYDRTRISAVRGEEPGPIRQALLRPHELLLAAANGLFRYDGESVLLAGHADTGDVHKFQELPGGLLLAAREGLFAYNGAEIIPLARGVKRVNAFQSMTDGLLIGADNGLFRYDGSRVLMVASADETGGVMGFLELPGAVLIAAQRGIFRFERGTVAHVGGDPVANVWFDPFLDTPAGVLIQGENGPFRYHDGRVNRVEGERTGRIFRVSSVAGAVLLIGDNGLFLFDGTRAARVPGESTGSVASALDTASGLLLPAAKGLFRVDGRRVARVAGEPIVGVTGLYPVSNGVLVIADHGLFRSDGVRVVAIPGAPVGGVSGVYDGPGGPLLPSERGLFYYDGGRLIAVPGAAAGAFPRFHRDRDTVLILAENGLLRVILQPLSAARVRLENAADLNGSAPSKIGILTVWSVEHACAAYASQLDLQVIARDRNDDDRASGRAVGFQPQSDGEVFQASLPIADPGRWTLRVVSAAGGTRRNVGAPAEPVAFVVAGSPNILSWLQAHWQTIASAAVLLLIMLNLAVLVAARYSAGAWRLATDEAWGKTALLPQRLLLRHWQPAQLWLLDLYVRQRRDARAGRPVPFLPLPLSGAGGAVIDSDMVHASIPTARHVWVQGGSGMGKTAMFLHLQERHFSGTEATSFAIFRRDRYVLVPIAARRFPEAPFDEKGGSAWLVACVLSLLSEGGLAFEDRNLLRAMLARGTLAIAMDGLNEVARDQAVLAFAAEFPAAPIFATSQEAQGPPFQVWHLPATIAEHVDGLLALYIGRQHGEVLAQRLRQSGLIQHLRSGYDVRLLVELARGDPKRVTLPTDRLGLYEAAVRAAWPPGDNRLELLRAAAWKLMSERGPNEDKRRLKPDEDAPADLLENLETVRERSGLSIRLVRATPTGFEFVHDQMNAYLAACWLADRPTISVIRDFIETSKVWQDSLEAQRTLWRFFAAKLDRAVLEALWIFAGDDDRRAVLGRALAEQAEREGWSLTRPSGKTAEAAV
jgi:hypothetical protein